MFNVCALIPVYTVYIKYYVCICKHYNLFSIFCSHQTTSLSLCCPCRRTGLRSTSWRLRRCPIRERKSCAITMATCDLFPPSHPAVSPPFIQVAASDHTARWRHEGQTSQQRHTSSSVWVSPLMRPLTHSPLLLYDYFIVSNGSVFQCGARCYWDHQPWDAQIQQRC